jgi:hypothetical protein
VYLEVVSSIESLLDREESVDTHPLHLRMLFFDNEEGLLRFHNAHLPQPNEEAFELHHPIHLA